MDAVIVIPTNRHQIYSLMNTILAYRFTDVGWRCPVIVVEDNPAKTLDLKQYNFVEHYSWEDIDSELGEDSWIIPRRLAAVRSFGFYKAWQKGPNIIITLDDDIKVRQNFTTQHYEAFTKPQVSEAWFNPLEGVKPRGIPYYTTQRELDTVINMGLWTGVPDVDAPTQLARGDVPFSYELKSQVVPIGQYYPMSSMNLAFECSITPMMYFLLQGPDWPYSRFEDIWAGIISKRICDHLGLAVTVGKPIVEHNRASNVWSNLQKEVSALAVNEKLWVDIDRIVLTGTSVAECYLEIADSLPSSEYWDKLAEAMHIWVRLFRD